MSTLNLLSGNVHLRNRKLPILWTGMYAQHLAEEYEKDPHVHPLLHIEAQQTLSKSDILKNKHGRWMGFHPATAGGYYFFPLIIYPKFVVIQTCFFENHSDMETAKRQKGIGSEKKRTSKKATRITNVHFSEPFVKAVEREGYDIDDFKDILLQFVNRSETSRKKYSKLANS